MELIDTSIRMLKFGGCILCKKCFRCKHNHNLNMNIRGRHISIFYCNDFTFRKEKSLCLSNSAIVEIFFNGILI